MRLTEIKKLKVVELRDRLQQLGLDVRGLKTELIGRLWSALEAGQAGENTQEQTPILPDTLVPAPPEVPVPLKVPVPLEVAVPPEVPVPLEVPARSASPAAAAGVPARKELGCSRELTDCGTQTGSTPDRGTRCPGEELDRGRAFYEFKEEIRYKRAKSPQPPVDREEPEEQDEGAVKLNPYDSHLHFEVAPDGACGQPRFCPRCPLLWSGCRLTHGVLQGRVGFEVRLERNLEEQAGLRVGWSMASTSLLLGEDELSFAYDGLSKKVSGGKEEQYGEPFSEGDIIGCYASLSTDAAVELSFHKNGRSMGVAFTLEASALGGRALFPHILCRNCSVRLQLEPAARPWHPGPPGFTALTALPVHQRVRCRLAPTPRAQSEVVLMVGLPGSGKSHWARTHVTEHPERAYTLLGTEELLACMISGGQRDSRLQQASQCLTELIKVAAQTPGNYILDQCNVLFSARCHKLRLFAGFRRRVVVVFPSAEEWTRRLSWHRSRDGEQIPDTALLKLQVSCSLPEQQAELLEELQYVELRQEQAQKLLQELKEEARRLLPPLPKEQEQRRPRLHKKRPHAAPAQPSHRRQRSRPQGRSQVRLDMQPWRHQLGYWTGTHQDQSYYYREFVGGGYGGYW